MDQSLHERRAWPAMLTPRPREATL
jgi:hypothetical protein